MTTAAQLAECEMLTPSQMKRFGERVRYLPNEQRATEVFILSNGGQVYTGIHSGSDWTKTRWWSKGWHYVNRTGEYAIVMPINKKGEA